MTQAAKDWTAGQWAEWAAGFLGMTRELLLGQAGLRNVCLHGKHLYFTRDNFNPLHDANHLMLVLDEIERRADKRDGLAAPWTLECWREEYGKNLYGCGVHHMRGLDATAWSQKTDSRNLAVLLAAKELDEVE